MDEAKYPYQGDVSRTATMADMANPLSLRLLHEVGGLEPGTIVVDAGAGTGTALGDEIIARGVGYVPIDVRTAAITAHLAAGHHEAKRGDITELPLSDNSMVGQGVLHSRFTHAWLAAGDQTEAWREAARIGLRRGAVIDYDYSKVGNVPNQQYRAVVEGVQRVLGMQGFRPDYGNQLPNDARQALNDIFGPGHYSLLVTREDIPADTLERRMAIVGETVDSVASALIDAGMEDTAKDLQQRLRALRHLQSLSLLEATDIPLPEMVGVAFKANDQPATGHGIANEVGGKYAGGTPCLPTLGGEFQAGNMVKAQHFNSGEGHPTIEAARDLFRRTYSAAGYFDTRLDITDILNDADPAELAGRSDTFVITEGDRLSATIRLVNPNGQGIWSLPTAKKLTPEARASLPKDMQQAVVGEAGYFASKSRNPLAPLKACAALVDTARTKGMEYVLIGTVEGRPTDRIASLFGPAIMWPEIEGQPVSTRVSGRVYRKEGIPLRVGYVKTATFFEQLAAHCEDADAMNLAGLDDTQANYMVRLCDTLQTQPETISA